MNPETQEKVSLSDLTPEQKKQLLKEAEQEAKAQKAAARENTEAYKKLSAEFVTNNVDIFVHRQIAIEADIMKMFKEYEAIIDIKKMVFGDKVLKQDSHTSTLEDGSASLTIGHNVSIGFNGNEKIGIEGIKAYIATLADDDENTSKLTKMVNVLLKPNKQGVLNPANIIQLNSLRAELNSEEFNTNLDIIIDSQIRVKSTMYVAGFKMINEQGKPPRKLEFRFSI